LACSNNTLSLSPTIASTGGTSCSGGTPGFCSAFFGFRPIAIVPVPEPSTWAMMLLGFAGLGFAAYRATRISAAHLEA
jgi:hypothetical protein